MARWPRRGHWKAIMHRLEGKTALVTGAAQGLGAETARTLARHGCNVLLTDLNCAGAEEVAHEIAAQDGGRAISSRQDVTSEADWAASLQVVEAEFGSLSVLVNNAGIVTVGSVEDLDLNQWRAGFAVNVDSVFLGTKLALPLLRASQPASIVNISSISGLIAGHNFANYNASKAAVWMLTKSVALHCARQGWDIRCNSIHPTFVRTPILDGLLATPDTEASLAKLERQVPLGRVGEPADVANAVVYLASDESRFVTGAELKLDGGMSAM
ncbi:MAG: SDR family oxidoreductase [Pseudomonadota bacterium]|nr:SDR family oxidoreductase [Pseudomonadota bacterium]